MADSTAVEQPLQSNGTSPIVTRSESPPVPQSPEVAAPDSDENTATSSTAPKPSQPPATSDPAMAKAVDNVMYSDIGVTVLLARLKQSIASLKELSAFLRKRSGLEEEHANALKKLCRSTLDGVIRKESRAGSYGNNFEDVVRVHDAMAEHGISFGLNAHQMSTDLENLAHDMERGRKQWKQSALAAEQRVQDAERLWDKAKIKYDSLAEDLDLVKTGDKAAGRHFALRPKTAAQHEEDLQRKVNLADQDYQQKVQNAQAIRQELTTTSRPQAVQAILQLIKECDSALTLQLQKYAAFNEKLMLQNGLLISPITGNENVQKGMREVISQIDNEKDFQLYTLGHTHQVPPQREIKYIQHPTLTAARNPPPQPYSQPTSSFQAFPSQPSQTIQPVQSTQPEPIQPVMSAPYSQPHDMSPKPQTSFSQLQPPSAVSDRNAGPSQNPRFSFENIAQPQVTHPEAPPTQTQVYPQENTWDRREERPHPTQAPYGQSPLNQVQPPPQQPPYGHSPYGQPPGFVPHHSSNNGHVAPSPLNPNNKGPANRGAFTPPRPVFGVHLNELFMRDQSPVPLVVYQCIVAVELFGLDHEGIYRVSGNATQVSQIKQKFDTDAASVDFRNPENFYHDVNLPATLLKQFFRELPEPVFTRQAYRKFMEAAAEDEEIKRRDGVHALINDLPDPNYATLRSLILHLNRIQQHSATNKMNSSNIALIFRPTLMGRLGSEQDATLQHRVVETILLNALQIFDED